MKRGHILAILFLILSQLGVADKFVDLQISTNCQDYSEITRSCGSGTDIAYISLSEAMSDLETGETIQVRGGTYEEQLKVTVSGSAADKILITGYHGEDAIITGSSISPAIDISGQNHIVVKDLIVQDVRRWLHARNSDYNTITGCTFKNALDSGGSSKTGIFLEHSDFNIISNNIIDRSTQDNLALLDSHHNLIQNNTITYAAHTLWTIKCGSYNILRDNYFHNEVQKIGEVYDCDDVGYDHDITSFNSTKRNVIEFNEFAYTASSGDHSPYSGIQYAGQDGIIRNNIFHNTIGPGLSLTLYGGEARHNVGNRVYHNVFADSDFAGIEISGASYEFSDNIIINNILQGSSFVANDQRWDWYTDELVGKPVQVKSGRTDGFRLINNQWFAEDNLEYLFTFGSRTSSSNPAQQELSMWETNLPALFNSNQIIDAELNEVYLPNNPIDAQYLTLAIGTGPSTILSVEDASYFTDGFGIVGGDEIILENGDTAVITSIDYQENTLTLSETISWTDGMGVTISNGDKVGIAGELSTDPPQINIMAVILGWINGRISTQQMLSTLIQFKG